MALHLTPEEHDSDPPQGWTVRKSARRWQLLSRNGGVLDTFHTKKDAEKARTSGFLFNLYEKEGRWFRGDTPSGWRHYSSLGRDATMRRFYRVESGTTTLLIPMAEVGTLADVRYVDRPVRAPEALAKHLPSPYVWSITLVEKD